MYETQNYYRTMILTSLQAILNRSAQLASGGFINTKLSLLTGEDFPAGDPIRGLSTIYSWIQGRGLESLAIHYRWLQKERAIPDDVKSKLIHACMKHIDATLNAMEKLRQTNNGRLLFMHNANSYRPLKIDSNGDIVETELNTGGPATMSELFYVKGLAVAASVLDAAKSLQTACRWYDHIHKDIIKDRFINDQQPLDPKNVAAKPVQNRQSQGSRMIALGAAFRFLEITGDIKYLYYGLEYLDYILANHVNLNQPNAPAELYDMWEFTDENRQPYYDADGRIMSDPGHVTEFTGIAGKLLTIAEQKGMSKEVARLDKYKILLPEILQKNFENGFSKNGFGIYKAVDLISRQPINSDMPWWPLPETMRSACLAMHYGNPDSQATCLKIFKKCSDAFRKYFVREDLHMMAYQTLSADGNPADVIPASPDADPGYHTNLSIIDCMQCLPAGNQAVNRMHPQCANTP